MQPLLCGCGQRGLKTLDSPQSPCHPASLVQAQWWWRGLKELETREKQQGSQAQQGLLPRQKNLLGIIVLLHLWPQRMAPGTECLQARIPPGVGNANDST